MTDFGSDVSCWPDLDLSFAPLTGPRVVAEAIARRLCTPRGTLPFVEDYGIDVRSWLNETMTRAKLAQIRRDVEAECLRDERVLAADILLAFNTQTSELRLAVTLTTADGPFSLVLSVTALSLSVLGGTSTALVAPAAQIAAATAPAATQAAASTLPIITGQGAPADASTAADGTIYIQTDAGGALYQRISGQWVGPLAK